MRDERTSHCVSTAIVMSQYRKTGWENNVVYLPLTRESRPWVCHKGCV